MAEGWLHRLGGDCCEAASADTATLARPLAIRAMAEVGTDLTAHTSKTLDRYYDQSWGDVITLCAEANAACPSFPLTRRRRHWSLPDPSRVTGSEAEQLAAYRAVRDAIGARVRALVEEARASTASNAIVR